MTKKATKKKVEAPVTDLTKIEAETKSVEAEVLWFKDKAEAMVIASDEDYAAASDVLDIVKSKIKAGEKMRKFFVDPLNAQVKNINALFKPQTQYAEGIEQTIKGKMADYYKKKEAVRIAEEARLQKIREAADAKRVAAGKEVIAEPVREVATPAKTVVTGASKSQVRKFWTHEIESINALPDDVKQAIMGEAYKKGIVKSVVQKFVDAGVREMTGVRIYEDVTIASGNVRQWQH